MRLRQKNRSGRAKNFAAQRGAVLVVALLLLLVMAIFAASIGQNTRLQQRMAGNVRDADLAFQAAEAAARAAENELWRLTTPPTPCSTLGTTCPLLRIGVLPADMNAYSWSAASSVEFGLTAAGGTAELASEPRYVIEELEQVAETPEEGKPKTWKIFYRITAHGVGGTNSTEAVVQSTFTRPF